MSNDAGKQKRIQPIAIQGMARLSSGHFQALRSRWITTIDALVASAATENGRAGLCSALGMDARELDHLLQDACDTLGEERYKELLTPRPGGPTGALIDDDQQQPTDGSTSEDGET